MRRPPECVSEDVIERCRLDLSPNAPWRAYVPLECPPHTNRGGSGDSVSDIFAAIASTEKIDLVLGESGKVKTVAFRRPTGGQVAVIDTLRFTIGEESFGRPLIEVDGVLVSDVALIVSLVSKRLEEIFGFGITAYTGHGGDFYERAYVLGESWGSVAIGGQRQNGTILVSLSGAGCLAAREGWEGRLYSFLSVAKRPQITRVDLAFDDFDGRLISVDIADRWWLEGGFTSWKRAPSHEMRGNWRVPDGCGRSLYVGKRANGKMCRIYEKGREQGDPSSEWVRAEVELRSTDRVIPLGVLLDPSGYFCGAYPCLACLAAEVAPIRVEVKSKSSSITVAACLANLRRCYGGYIHVLAGVLGVDSFLEAVSSPDRWPARLLVPHFSLSRESVHSWVPG